MRVAVAAFRAVLRCRAVSNAQIAQTVLSVIMLSISLLSVVNVNAKPDTFKTHRHCYVFPVLLWTRFALPVRISLRLSHARPVRLATFPAAMYVYIVTPLKMDVCSVIMMDHCAVFVMPP